jgi:hypothetical protein
MTRRCSRKSWAQPFLLFALTVIAAANLAAQSLTGTWQHVRDSGGWHVLSGGSITMVLDTNGQATLTAQAPGKDPLTENGTWSQQGGRITIKVEAELDIDNKPFQLQGDTLTLPVQFSTTDPGTSTWTRVKSQGFGRIFEVFNNAIDVGDGAEVAAQEAAKEARQQEGIEDAQVLDKGEGLALTVKPVKPGSEKPKVFIWFADKSSRKAPTAPPRPAMISPLAGDPFTHLDAKNPKGDPDAPQKRTALIVAPFQSKVYLAIRPEVFAPGDTKQRKLTPSAESVTFQSMGDDPGAIAKLLEKAGYQVTLLVDDQATPGPVFRALQSHPSVIYFATHGGEDDTTKQTAIGIAGFIGVAGKDSSLTGPVAVQRLNDLMMKENVPGPAAAGVSVGCLDEVNGSHFCFPYVWPRFFQEALGKQGVPDSLVFLDACHTATFPAMAQAFKARVFLGYDPTVNGKATPLIARYIFTNMLRQGHSVREAWDRALHLTEGAGAVWPEDQMLNPASHSDVDLKGEAAKLKAWGKDYNPYFRINNPVFWLMRMARESYNDIDQGANSIDRCLREHWVYPGGKKPGENALADQFCSKGILGSHVPTAPEVINARSLVSGTPDLPSGRFVLR